MKKNIIKSFYLTRFNILFILILSIFIKVILEKNKEQKNYKLKIKEYNIQNKDEINCPSLTKTKIKFEINRTLEKTEMVNDIKKQFNEKWEKDSKKSEIFENVFFMNKKNTKKSFCVTKSKIKRDKSCIILSGNNDYFHYTELFNLHEKYNIYAIHLPSFGFSIDLSNLEPSNFFYMKEMFSYIDLVLEYFDHNKIDLLIGHSTGGLIGTLYTEHMKNVNKILISSPYYDYFGDPKSSSIMTKEWFQEYIARIFGLFLKKINLNADSNKYNMTGFG